MFPSKSVALLVVLLPMAGCLQNHPTTPSGVASNARSGSTQPAVVPILPTAIGSIRQFPEMSILDVASVSGDAQSSYFKTTETNREIRRGFAEFAVPAFPEIFGARVALRETRATISAPVSPDRHELSSYTDVDLVVNVNDYDRATSSVGAFETDSNLEHQTFEFDVSNQVASGALLGFRMNLALDQDIASMGWMGTSFSGSSTPAGVTLEVVTTVAAASGYLEGVIHAANLPEELSAGLLASVERARMLLTDDNANNDAGACGQLAAFVQQLDTLEEDQQISSFSAWYWRQLATNIQAGLACGGGA